MARAGRFFIHEVNVVIVSLAALATVACSIHYISLVNELQHARQEVCAAKLEAIASRNPYLKAAGNHADRCAALEILGGSSPTERPSWRSRLSL